MKLKRLLMICLTLTLSVGVVACSSQSKSGESSSQSPSSKSSSSPVAGKDDKSKKYTISYMDFTFSEIPPMDSVALKAVNEKFNIDLKPMIFKANDYEEKQTATVAGGDVPDVMALDGGVPPANYFKWAKQGAFLPLDDYIDKYDSLKLVPKSTWESLKVNGKIYAIPKYFPKTMLGGMIIRQDWLDNLGLKMPTNLEELKQVAIAFTTQDPNKDGKNDTYGFTIGQNLEVQHQFGGAYWDWETWYHKDEKGKYIPGIIGPGRKEVIQMYADLYKKGAITKDFPVIKDYSQIGMEFWGGKAGIYIGGARGMNEKFAETLAKIDPKAKVAAIPPFKAPDGSVGLTSGSGMYMMVALSSKLKDNPGKVERILNMTDFSRKFVPLSERNDSNKDFDWLYGGMGKGYQVLDGKPVLSKATEGLSPLYFMTDKSMWAPTDQANEYSKTYKSPILRELAAQFEDMHSKMKHYDNPKYLIDSDLFRNNWDDLVDNNALVWQSKMVVGQIPVSDWDKYVKEWMDKGGAAMIKEANESLQGKKLEGWK